jgi:hypothetical protein
VSDCKFPKSRVAHLLATGDLLSWTGAHLRSGRRRKRWHRPDNVLAATHVSIGRRYAVTNPPRPLEYPIFFLFCWMIIYATSTVTRVIIPIVVFFWCLWSGSWCWPDELLTVAVVGSLLVSSQGGGGVTLSSGVVVVAMEDNRW